MPFKNQDLGWIRVNLKKEEDKALRDFASKTNLAPGLDLLAKNKASFKTADVV